MLGLVITKNYRPSGLKLVSHGLEAEIKMSVSMISSKVSLPLAFI